MCGYVTTVCSVGGECVDASMQYIARERTCPPPPPPPPTPVTALTSPSILPSWLDMGLPMPQWVTSLISGGHRPGTVALYPTPSCPMSSWPWPQTWETPPPQPTLATSRTWGLGSSLVPALWDMGRADSTTADLLHRMQH